MCLALHFHLNRVPTFLGSLENVFELDQFYKYYGEGAETDDDDGTTDDK